MQSGGRSELSDAAVQRSLRHSGRLGSICLEYGWFPTHSALGTVLQDGTMVALMPFFKLVGSAHASPLTSTGVALLEMQTMCLKYASSIMLHVTCDLAEIQMMPS